MKNGRKKFIYTQGISPYFLNTVQIQKLLEQELLPLLPRQTVLDEIHFYGTGCNNPISKRTVQKALKKVFPAASVHIDHDLMGAALALCGESRGIACILGTGSNSCYFNGKRIVSNSPGLGYILGDEGSGAYLGKKVLQYYLYHTFDEELRYKFDAAYTTNRVEILENIYKKPLPNRYLASFTMFLAENRGHYMIENILEDGLNDFFFTHLCKYRESWKYPIHFTGAVAFGFADVIRELMGTYEFELGKILKRPMDGLIHHHGRR